MSDFIQLSLRQALFPFPLFIFFFIHCQTSGQPASPENVGTQGSLIIADFESGLDPANLGGHIGKWDNNGKPEVRVEFVTDGAASSHGAVCVTLSGNDGKGDGNWTGGGLTLSLLDKPEGINLEAYDSLQFDVKMTAGSRLPFTSVKIEDADGGERPERLIASYGIALTDIWQTVTIPLSEFGQLKTTDPQWWKKADLSRATRFVTVSVHSTTIPNGDGSLYFDNIIIKR